MRSAFVGAVVMVSMLGCGGVDDTSRGSSPVTSGTSGLSCTQSTSCAAFSCSCGDGTRWDTARFCLNNVCQGEAATCSNACKDRLGTRQPPTSNTGGGSAGTGASCSQASTCQAYSCQCADGTAWDTARYCLNNTCQGPTATCANACKGRSSTPPATQQTMGCTVRRWSNEHSVTMETYGTGNTRAVAIGDAQSQCSSASWTSTFCSGAADYCALEPLVPYTCTFSKYSSRESRTIRFVGSGSSQTDAKNDAVRRCLASGAWRGWFCTSGSMSCARD
jgi:hypothetical protein